MMVFITTLFSAIFVTNILFYKLDGMTFYTQDDKLGDVLFKGIKSAIVTLLTVLFTYPINQFVLKTLDLEVIIPLVVIVGIYGVNFLIDKVMKKFKKEDIKEIKTDYYVRLNPLVFTASIVAVLNSSLIVSVGYALGYAIGHLLMMILILTITPKISLPGIPKVFKGVPAVLIAVGLIAMAFMGLAGIL